MYIGAYLEADLCKKGLGIDYGNGDKTGITDFPSTYRS